MSAICRIQKGATVCRKFPPVPATACAINPRNSSGVYARRMDWRPSSTFTLGKQSGAAALNSNIGTRWRTRSRNHEPIASTPNVPDHLDKLVIAQVVHQADAYGHVGSRQNLPNGVQLENRELPYTTLRRTQIHTQYVRPNLPPHLFQQAAVPTPDIQNASHRLPITPQGAQDRPMITQQAVRQGKRAVHPRQHFGLLSAAIQDLCLKGAPHLSV